MKYYVLFAMNCPTIFIFIHVLRAILNKSWRQNPTKQQLYGHLPPITKTIQVRRAKHAGHCWRSRDELISDVILWTPFSWTCKIRAASSNLHTAALRGYAVMNEREEWQERVKDIHADDMTR